MAERVALHRLSSGKNWDKFDDCLELVMMIDTIPKKEK